MPRRMRWPRKGPCRSGALLPDKVPSERVHEETGRRGVHSILVADRLQYLQLISWDASPVPWVRVSGQLEKW